METETKNFPKKNAWLVDEEYLKNRKYEDKYYLINLCHHIYNFTQNAPVNIVTGFDTKFEDRIYVNVGENSKCFFLDNTVSYYDFITLIKKWLYQFYPKYECTVKYMRKYDEDEIIRIREQCLLQQKDFDIAKLMDEEVEDTKIERGVIIKIFLLQDSFILKENKQKYLHKTVSLYRKLPLRDFMRTVRGMMIDKAPCEDIRQYIFENSDRVKEVSSDARIDISYAGAMMVNFIKINFEELKNENFSKDTSSNLKYRWGKFDLHFENETLMNDCVSMYHKLKGSDSD